MTKSKLVLTVFIASLISIAGCSKKEGCTDNNANNFDSDAEKNSGCVFRYSSTVDVSGVSTANPNGDPWDSDGTGPDLKMNFGKGTSSGYDFTTNTQNNQSATTLTPSSSIQFTNEEWKYQLVDDDLFSASEVIATGTFNPVTQGGSNVISITNGNVIIKFNYTVH
ncbi:MAG: hypothetical protein ABI855_14205 [Bacteroidota bacterium]